MDWRGMFHQAKQPVGTESPLCVPTPWVLVVTEASSCRRGGVLQGDTPMLHVGTEPGHYSRQTPRMVLVQWSSPADWDLDLDYPLPTSSSHSSAHELQLLEEQVKKFDKAKKKTHRLYKQLQQQFLKEQERKMAWRKKTAEQFKRSLEVFDRRSGKVPGPTSRLRAAEAKPLEQRRVQRAPPAGRAPAASTQEL
ncbi:uncharacterized protein LOC143695462 [Agelaius phoeniceus]|uniref:uncharacterized protein LOC143695462 n=1 Tax=Agelaius phoeniceus TaxID=39638 RepID=UPI004054DAA5